MFSFKQFTIRQERTAMKVCTDACVLGAYADLGEGGRVLDIGTGTGLLALMAAQRNPTALIDAVEVDEAAFGQASENVTVSPFAERVNVVHERIQDFNLIPGSTPITGERKLGIPDSSPLSYNSRGAGDEVFYDRILTNPPFYTNHLRSPDKAVNRALHTNELPFPELISSVVRLMKPAGEWWVLLPPYETEKLIELTQGTGLEPFKQLFLRHNAQKPVFRVVTGFSFRNSSVKQETLTIYKTSKQTEPGKNQPRETYTSEFRELLRDFYLIF
ncbi:methyltransferase [Spirosoma sp. KCTC 42546]|uniref:tRNA1(Val) (adenine(37)-N6)-methyltransferase n=1 Tax=Spirosoma sp. KCTC 42546 TaxID=2520506 RepID=UPI00115BB962|nr:methyltransferase [Spirosoma sp. KCTC 42546]QDK79656.1 methyltransferase [Spirosoma sp. KCTC 42546]